MNRKKSTTGKRTPRSQAHGHRVTHPTAYCRSKPINAMDAMDIRLTNLLQLVVFLAAIPFFISFVAIDAYARKARRRTYYERERERRIELADGRRMKLCEYASVDDLIEAADGKFYVVDKEEYARRVRLAQDRRRIRKHQTLNPKPSANAMRTQWEKVKNSHEDMLRFGSMLCDLEAYVDNSLRRDKEGNIQGRNPGIKGWLGFYCPEIYRKYKTAMRYKQMAVKARQIIEMNEPYPLSVALGDEIPGAEETKMTKCETKIIGNTFESIASSPGAKMHVSHQQRGFSENETSVGTNPICGESINENERDDANNYDHMKCSGMNYGMPLTDSTVPSRGGMIDVVASSCGRVAANAVAEWRHRMSSILSCPSSNCNPNRKERISCVALSKRLQGDVMASCAMVSFIANQNSGLPA